MAQAAQAALTDATVEQAALKSFKVTKRPTLCEVQSAIATELTSASLSYTAPWPQFKKKNVKREVTVTTVTAPTLERVSSCFCWVF